MLGMMLPLTIVRALALDAMIGFPADVEQGLLAALISAGLIYPIVKSPRRYSRLLPIAILTGLAFMTIATRVAFHSYIKNDFLQFRTGATYAGSKDFYNESSRAATQESLQQNQFPMPFVRLPFYALLLYPISILKYETSYILWQLFSVSTFVAASFFWRSIRGVVVLACVWSFPVAVALVRGQDIGLLLLLMSFAVFLFHKQRFWLSGAMFALLAIKWNIVLTLPLLIVGTRRPGLRGGFAAGILLLVAISFAVAGTNWPAEYFRIIMSPEVSPHIKVMPNLAGLVGGLPLFPWSTLLGTLVVLALDWAVVRGNVTMEYKVAATLASSILITPHVYSYDCALLIPLLVAVAYQTGRRDLRYVSVLLLTPTVYALLSSPRWHFIPSLIFLWFLVLVAIDKPTITSDQAPISPTLSQAV